MGGGAYQAGLPGSTLVTGPVFLLIHGYNTTVARAQERYAALLEPIARRFRFDPRSVWFVSWKGYYDFGTGDPVKLFSGPSYPLQVKAARKSGIALGEWIRKCAAGLFGAAGPFVVIAHSLGCRLALEALLATLSPTGRSPVARLFLMGAAVPTKMLQRKGKLALALTSTKRRVAMCSRADSTLFWLFPVGEAACGEGFFPTALGWSGEPSASLSARVWRTCGHSGYFDDGVTADYLAEAFGCSVPRRLMQRYQESYEGAPPRRLPSRSPAARSIGRR